MGLAVVRSLGAPKRPQSSQDVEDFEQELVDQFLLASVASGYSDAKVGDDRAALFEFSRFLGRPLWTAEPSTGSPLVTLAPLPPESRDFARCGCGEPSSPSPIILAAMGSLAPKLG